MVPAGYMYKTVMSRPDFLRAPSVSDIYSVSGCISEDFCDWINYWRHNGFWFFDSLSIMQQIAAAEGLDLSLMIPFYYRIYPFQWDDEEGCWRAFEPDSAFETAVQLAGDRASFRGFDVVTYSTQNAAECSPLSCNHFAERIEVNPHCLFNRFEEAKAAVEAGTFVDGEPGPHRILEVSIFDVMPHE